MKKTIVVTVGDPAGCGPFITLKAIDEFNKKANFIVVADEVTLRKYSIFKKVSRKIELIDVKTPGINNLKLGCPSYLGGKASINYLKIALKIIRKEKIQKLVTAPLSKEAVKMSLKDFSGHTEFLASYFRVRNVLMMMVDGSFRVVLATRHIPLRDVPSAITKRLIQNTLKLTHKSLKDIFHIRNPRIAVASLNPHAGVDTFLDKEELLVKNVIDALPFKVYGPYPSDTLFLLYRHNKYDCVIACYHDQAMIPFKLLFFKKGVNVTLGLPIIRVSPAHGTAFDIVRKKRIPSYYSMLSALNIAEELSL